MQIQIDLHTEWSSFGILIVLSPRSLWVCFISSLPPSALWFLCLHDFIITSLLQHSSVNRNNISPWNLDSFWVGLLVGQMASHLHLRTRHSYTLLLLYPAFYERKAQVHSWGESCRIIQRVLNSAHGEPPPPRCYLMPQHEEHAKVHCLYFWTCQCQPKREIRKCHGSSCCSALCSPNSETKARLMKIFSRMLLHLCSKKGEKPKEPSTLLIIY